MPHGAYTVGVLNALKVGSYAELATLDTLEVIRRMDDGVGASMNEADALVAVLTLSAVAKLEATTKALDGARKGFERATIILAVLGVLVAVLGIAGL